MQDILKKKREAVKAMALQVNKKIHTKTENATAAPPTTTAKTSRWGS